MNRFFLIIISILISTQLYSQLQVDVQIRPRSEIWNGYKELLPDSANIPSVSVSQRSRVSLHYTKDLIEAAFSIQDVRLWGDEDLFSSTGVKGNTVSLDLFEAWFQFPLSENHQLKVGRQEISLDDQRLIARRNWNQYGCAYDAILYNFSKDKLEIKSAVSWNNDAYNKFGLDYNTTKMKSFDFLYLKRKFKNASYLSFNTIFSGFYNDNSDRINFGVTYGPYAYVESGNLKLNANTFMQTGQNKDGTSIEAYLASGELESTFNKLIATGGFALISGDSDPYSGKDRSFDLLYGARHRYYGDIDFFSNLSKSTHEAGLLDLYLKLGYQLSDKSILNLAYHYFQTDKKAIYPENNVTLDKKLGHEVDFDIKFNLQKNLELQTGISCFSATDNMVYIFHENEAAQKMAYFGWIQLTYKGKFESKL